MPEHVVRAELRKRNGLLDEDWDSRPGTVQVALSDKGHLICDFEKKPRTQEFAESQRKETPLR